MAQYSELVTAQKNYGELKKTLKAIEDLKSLKFMMEIAGDYLYNCRVEFISLWAKAAAIIQNGFGKPPGTLVDDIASMFYLLAKANVEPCLPSKKKNTATASTAVAVVDAVVCVAVNSDVVDRDAAVDNIATAGVAVVVHNADVGCVVTNSHDVGDSAAAVPDDDVHVPAVAAVVSCSQF